MAKDRIDLMLEHVKRCLEAYGISLNLDEPDLDSHELGSKEIPPRSMKLLPLESPNGPLGFSVDWAAGTQFPVVEGDGSLDYPPKALSDAFAAIARDRGLKRRGDGTKLREGNRDRT